MTDLRGGEWMLGLRNERKTDMGRRGGCLNNHFVFTTAQNLTLYLIRAMVAQVAEEPHCA